MRNFVSPHCHPQSLDSASTVEDMVRREVELETGYTTATDHGTMASALHVLKSAKKNGVKPILGIEAYFRDDSCHILESAGVEDKKAYNKYYHCTMHFLDQEAYMAGVKILSNRSIHSCEFHGGEAKALFNWEDLKVLGGLNVTMGSSCLVGMVQRHLLANRVDLAMQYYRHMKSLVKPGNFFVEVFPHRCTHNWENNVAFRLSDQKEDERFWPGKKVCVNGEMWTAEKYAAHYGRISKKPGMKTQVLEYVMHYREKKPVGKEILGCEKRREFVQNPCSVLMPEGDLQLFANRFMLDMAMREGDPVLISDDAHYVSKEQKLVQDARLGNGKEMWKFFGYYNRMSTEEAVAYFKTYLGTTDSQVQKWVENSYAWAERFDKFDLNFNVSLPTKFYAEEGKTSLDRTFALIKKHGRYDPSDRSPDGIARTERLAREIEILHRNGKIDLLPYFFPLEEVCSLYKEKGLLTGPGRGSAAGLLLSYVLGITHVDPIKHELSLERFITKERILAGHLPDIDQDLEDRSLLVGDDGNSGWLRGRFGAHVAQISTDTNLRLRSSIKDVHRFIHGKVDKEIEGICRKLPTPPQGIDDKDFVFGYGDDDGVQVPGLLETSPTLKAYSENYPKEWGIVKNMMGIPRQKSRHACAYVIADKPIGDFIPLTKISDVMTTQFTAEWVEAAGGIKVDFLVVNSLKDIRGCLELVEQNTGVRPDPWTLPQLQEVFDTICDGETETVFQLNTSGAKGFLPLFTDAPPHNNRSGKERSVLAGQGSSPNGKGKKYINSIDDISVFTALDRPGPLDFKDPEKQNRNMLEEYAARKRGESVGSIDVLNKILEETHGIIVYQEQLQKVAQVVGGMAPTTAEEFRRLVSKKKLVEVMQMKPVFMEGSKKDGHDLDTADKIWNMMVTFGQYGFNKSHSMCYAYIAYACAYLKKIYPLEWWCSVLQNAKKEEVAKEFWKYCSEYTKLPDINLSQDSFAIVGKKIIAPISLLDGVGEAVHREICANRPFKDIDDFVRRTNSRVVHKGVVCKLIAAGAADSLFPEDMSLLERLQAYMKARAGDGKKVEPVPEAYLNLSPMRRYELKKSILAVCNGDLTSMVLLDPPKELVGKDASGHYRWPVMTQYGSKMHTFVGSNAFKAMAEEPVANGNYRVAVAAYVISERRFQYKNNQCEAVELMLDIDGFVTPTVKWPNRETGELEAPAKMAKKLALVAMSRRMGKNSPFYVDDIRLLVKGGEETAEETAEEIKDVKKSA